MLLPGKPDHPLQIIDVRDLAYFTIDCLDNRIVGTYNTVTPVGSVTMGSVIDDSVAVTSAQLAPVWVDEAFVAQAQENSTLQNWGMFPIWAARSGNEPGISKVSGALGRAAGLQNRPVRETIRDLLAWWKTLPEERTATMKAGMSAAQEAELIALWKQQSG
jgi:2'-hydroxyisoflavone reductase